MKLVYFILLWIALFEIARVKFKEDWKEWKVMLLMFAITPIIHATILIGHGLNGWTKDDWNEF